MSWGRFSPRPPAQLSVLAMSGGTMFGFIKTCECKKKKKRREWEKVGHARNRKKQKVFPYPSMRRCRIAPFRCVWIKTVKERMLLQNPPSDKLLWRTPCQSNWLLCTPQQIKRTWLWNLKIKTKAPSSAVCKITDSAAADCVLNKCNYIPELAGGAKVSPWEVINNSIFIQTQPGHWQTWSRRFSHQTNSKCGHQVRKKQSFLLP